MNQLITYNNLTDGSSSRRYTGFPLNSTLVNSYTPDTIRGIISHAAAGKPYTTAVWIRISRVGIQISAQDPQIARTRIPVFIPIGLVHDIFMQPTINNIICIVYDEVKSNLKGVLLYVVHPNDAHLLREDFRLVKQSTYTKGHENPVVMELNGLENNRLFSPPSQQPNEPLRNNNNKFNRHNSPKRILYVRDNEKIINQGQTVLPQLNYTPLKNSYHSSRDNSAHRRHKSPRKHKTAHSTSKTSDDNGSKHRRKHRSRSPKKPARIQTPVAKNNHEDIDQEKEEEEDKVGTESPPSLPQQQPPTSAWQMPQPAPMIPMGIYSRYVPKTIPLPSGETIKTTLPDSNNNGHIIAHIEPLNDRDDPSLSRSPSRSRSISPKRQDQQIRHRPLSAQNGEAGTMLVQSSHHHHRRHHHHHHSSSKPDPNIYNTISHSSRTQSKYISPLSNINNNNNTTDDPDTKQYLKQLITDMQAMKLEMNKIRLASSTIGSSRGRSDSLRINLKELRHDIDVLRARMAMTPRISQ